jgi:hypothetical protein
MHVGGKKGSRWATYSTDNNLQNYAINSSASRTTFTHPGCYASKYNIW